MANCNKRSQLPPGTGEAPLSQRRWALRGPSTAVAREENGHLHRDPTWGAVRAPWGSAR